MPFDTPGGNHLSRVPFADRLLAAEIRPDLKIPKAGGVWRGLAPPNAAEVRPVLKVLKVKGTEW